MSTGRALQPKLFRHFMLGHISCLGAASCQLASGPTAGPAVPPHTMYIAVTVAVSLHFLPQCATSFPSLRLLPVLLPAGLALGTSGTVACFRASARAAGSCVKQHVMVPECDKGMRPELDRDISTKLERVDKVGFFWRLDLVQGTSDTYYIRPIAGGCEGLQYLSTQDCRSHGGLAAVDFWRANGINQQWQLVPTGRRADEFYIRSVARAAGGCSSYLSVQSCGGSNLLDTWGAAGGNQAFILSCD